MAKFEMPFRYGDVVEVKQGTFKGRNIIHETQRCGGSWEYSSDRGAWIPHGACKLVEPASETSIKELHLSIDAESAEDEDEE